MFAVSMALAAGGNLTTVLAQKLRILLRKSTFTLTGI